MIGSACGLLARNDDVNNRTLKTFAPKQASVIMTIHNSRVNEVRDDPIVKWAIKADGDMLKVMIAKTKGTRRMVNANTTHTMATVDTRAV